MGRSPACPACAQSLVVFELDGIEVDRCLACGGTWLDDGELALIAQRAGAGTAAAPDPIAALRGPVNGTAGTRACPRCGQALETIPAPGGPGAPVELDRCPRGDGLWFDAKELERLLASDAGDAAGASVTGFLSKLFRASYEH